MPGRSSPELLSKLNKPKGGLLANVLGGKEREEPMRRRNALNRDPMKYGFTAGCPVWRVATRGLPAQSPQGMMQEEG